MAHLQGRSKTDLDEKDDTEATQVNTLEMVLTKYHEQRVGSLVLDPECVCFPLVSLVRLADFPPLQQRGTH